MKKPTIIIITVFMLLNLLFSFMPKVISQNMETENYEYDLHPNVVSDLEKIQVSCQTYGFTNEKKCEKNIPITQARELVNIFKELLEINAQYPQSSEVKLLRSQLLTIAQNNDLIPKNFKLPDIAIPTISKSPNHPLSDNRAAELFCNYVSFGSGSAVPVIVFPRLLPILLTPIPRLYLGWSATEGVTSCGNLVGKTGFIAEGVQRGTLLGFWGIGFSIFLPPFMNYGLFGYAFYASVAADNIRFFPPNEPPILNPVFPLNGAQNIPTTTSEIQFYIRDPEGKLMNYQVTTSPPIGSDNGLLKTKGTYSVPISGLQPSTWYQWTVEVSDNKNTVSKTFSFTTS